METHDDPRCRCGASWWVHAVTAQIDPSDAVDAANLAAEAASSRRLVCGACGEAPGRLAVFEPPDAPASARDPGLAWAALAGAATMMSMIIVLA